MSRLEIHDALRNLGFNATGIGISIAFDAISTYQLSPILIGKVTETALRLFGKSVSKLTESAAIAAADGPLPIGDIIAVVFAVWTAYDVHSSRKEFQQEIYTSVNNSLNSSAQAAREQAMAYAKTTLQQNTTLQSAMGSQTLVEVSR